MSSCVFCEIAAGREIASTIYEDAECVAFMDSSPINQGHALVVPRAHATYLADLTPELGASMFKLALRLSEALRASGVRAEGVNMYLADGEAGGQEVFHAHLHVFPRFEGDGFRLHFGPRYGDKPARVELERVAGLIRVALQRVQS